MPVFIKKHHQGEYVFDFSWAETLERYGRNYYSRLVTSVPFTPSPARRIWVAQGKSLTASLYQTLLQAIDELAEPLSASTWHGLFFPKMSEAVAKCAQSLRAAAVSFMAKSQSAG